MKHLRDAGAAPTLSAAQPGRAVQAGVATPWLAAWWRRRGSQSGGDAVARRVVVTPPDPGREADDRNREDAAPGAGAR